MAHSRRSVVRRYRSINPTPRDGGKKISPERDGTMDILHYLQARLNVKSERGAALVEYALLLALIAVVCIAAISLLGNSAKNKFTSVANSIS